MFCEKCGVKLLENSRFCVSCGAKIGGQAAAPGAAQPAIPISPPPPPPPPPAYQPAPRQADPSASPVYRPAAQPSPGLSSGPAVQGSPSYKPQSTHETGVPAGAAVLSVGQYLVMFILLCIPIVNIILLFVWSFGSAAPLNKKNFARAALIMAAISVILWIIAGGAIMGILGGLTGGYY